MKQIPLSRGLFALVDDEDFTRLNQHKWSALKSGRTFYARANITLNGKRTGLLMHKKIISTPNGQEIDHLDGNGLNNQKSNLRTCTHKENTRNRTFINPGKSGFKGVYFNSNTNRWFASIKTEKTLLHIGCFSDKLDAARHYNLAAKEHFGEFAKYNDVSPMFPTTIKSVATKRSLCGFRGVSMDSKSKRWKATFCLDYVRIHLGYFDTPELAAMAYDKKAIEVKGDFARLNFP